MWISSPGVWWPGPRTRRRGCRARAATPSSAWHASCLCDVTDSRLSLFTFVKFCRAATGTQLATAESLRLKGGRGRVPMSFWSQHLHQLVNTYIYIIIIFYINMLVTCSSMFLQWLCRELIILKSEKKLLNEQQSMLRDRSERSLPAGLCVQLPPAPLPGARASRASWPGFEASLS